MINIQNESSLHNTLKIYYSNLFDGQTEVKKDGHIYDIVTKNGTIIEIQTKNLGSLLPKLKDILNKNLKIILVYPLVINTKIYLTDNNGELISKRKSNKKGCIYDIFSELTKLYEILLCKNFTLEILEINLIEHRIRTQENVQSLNKKRRYKKNWIKVNKRLDEIIDKKIFKTKKDYLNLLPKELENEFCAKDLKKILQKNKSIPSRIYNNTNLIIWVLKKMELITETKIQNRSHYYKINN